DGNPTDVTCTCSNSDVALTRQDVGVWQFQYNGTQSNATFTIDVASVANPSLTGTVDVSMANIDTVSVSYDVSSGIARAAPQSGGSEFFWAVDPPSAGTAGPTPGNTSQATINITSLGSGCTISAFYADPDSNTYGLGNAIVAPPQ